MATAAEAAPPSSSAAGPAAAAGGATAGANAELIRPGLYRLGAGAGAGRALVRVGAVGAVVVDPDGFGSAGELIAEIRRLATSPGLAVRAVILTSPAPDAAGRIDEFIAAGIPVIVQQRALDRVGGGSARRPAWRSGSLVAYDTDHLLRVGEFEVGIEHVGRGRTGADSIVVFPDLRVVAIGELFTAAAPRPDCASGGSFAGWAAAIDHLLWSEFDIAVPSRGPAVDKDALRAFRASLDAMARRAGPSTAAAPGCLSGG